MVDADAFGTFEAAGWETRAADYDHYWRHLTSRLSDPLLDAARVGPRTRVLDIACGGGYLAGRSADRGAITTGIDIAMAMVARARHRFPGVGFQQADAQSLPFRDGVFDAVVGSLAMPHLGRPEQAVAECGRVLAPDGRLALTVWDFPQRARLVGVLAEAVREVGATSPEAVPAGPDFFRFADDAEFHRLLADQGFLDVEVKSLMFTHTVQSADELWDGLLRGTVRTAAVIRGQSTDVVRRIRAGFNRRLDAYRTGQTYAVPVSFKLAAGWRS